MYESDILYIPGLHSVFSVTQGQFIYSPQNTAVVLGDYATARFDCKTDQQGFTIWDEVTAANRRRLSLGTYLLPHIGDDGYELSTADEALNMTVPSNSLEQVGHFKCRTGSVDRSSAKLVILGELYIQCWA